MTDTTEQHASDELCFFCAPDDVIVDNLFGDGPRTTIYMQRPESFCPNITFDPAAESRGDGEPA
jgi:hypothetical protein